MAYIVLLTVGVESTTRGIEAYLICNGFIKVLDAVIFG